MKQLVWRVALALALGLALNAGLLYLMRDVSEGPVIELAQMRFIKSDAPRPPDESAPWLLRALPDNWQKTNPGQSGYGWYRASLPPPMHLRHLDGA